MTEHVSNDNQAYYQERPELTPIVYMFREYRALGGVGLAGFTEYVEKIVK